MIKLEKGITLITLVITIVVMLIIVGTVISVGLGNLKTKNLTSMYTDLKSINDKVAVYYNKYGTLPLKEKFMGSYEFLMVANPNDDEDGYYIVDINKLDKLVLTKKLSWTDNDVYIINSRTHTVYYPEGIKLDGETYYRYPGEYSKLSILNLELEVSASTTELTSFLTINIIGQAESGIKSYILPNGTTKTYGSGTKVIRESYPVNKNGTYEFMITNNNGKTETKTITISNILESDIQISASPIEMTAENVTVTIEWPIESEIGTKQIQVGDGEWQTVTGSTSKVTVEQNSTVTAKISNGATDLSSAKLIVNNIDKNEPIVTANNAKVEITEGSSNNISGYFTYEANGNSEITEVVYTNTSKNDASIENTNSLTIGNYTIKCTVTKETGKTSSATMTLAVLPDVNNKGLANKNITLKPSENSNVQIVIPTGWGPAILESSNWTTSLPGESGKVIGIMPPEQWCNITVDDINQGIVVVNNTVTYDGGSASGTVPDFEEFVWVPIADFGNFKRIAWTSRYYDLGESKVGKHPFADTVTYGYYSESKNTNLYNSVKTNKGFFIARYEAAQGTGNIPRSKRGRSPWNYVSYNSAISYCSNSSIKNLHVTYGVEWDSMLNWFIGNAKIINQNTTMTLEDIQSSSAYWGNNGGSKGNAANGSGVIQVTGYSEYWKANNIYDLVGGLEEMTQERFGYDDHASRSARGGRYYSGGSWCAASRFQIDPSPSYEYRRFSCMLLLIILNSKLGYLFKMI